MPVHLPPLETQRRIASILSAYNDLIENSWTVAHFGEIARQTTETIHPDSICDDIPYVGLADMPSKSIVLMNWRNASDVASPKRVFRRGNILFGGIRPSSHKASLH